MEKKIEGCAALPLSCFQIWIPRLANLGLVNVTRLPRPHTWGLV